jgi:hypothetical protein
VIELCGNLDVWTTDDTRPIDSEETYQPRDLLKRPIVKGCEHFHLMLLATFSW